MSAGMPEQKNSKARKKTSFCRCVLSKKRVTPNRRMKSNNNKAATGVVIMDALICQECHSRHESAVFDILKQLGRVEGSPFREMCMVHQYPVERDSKETGCGKKPTNNYGCESSGSFGIAAKRSGKVVHWIFRVLVYRLVLY